MASHSDYARLRSCVYERHMKRKLVLAVDHFNKDHKKGLQFLQVWKGGRFGGVAVTAKCLVVGLMMVTEFHVFKDQG